MKVHHILSETLDLKQIDGLWRIWDTVKKSAVGIGFETQGAAEEARDRLRTQRVSVPTSSAPTGDTPSLSSGVRPGTPTSDTLSRGEKRRLSRRGTISRNGVTYTVANINAADAELKLKVQPLSVDNNTPSNKKIDGDWLAKAKEGAAKSFKSKAFMERYNS